MIKKIKVLIFYLAILLISCTSPEKEITVLQFNIWGEGASVENGFDAIVDNIIHANPDMVTFSELRNYNNVDFIDHLITELEKKGATYYGESSESTGIISKYPITEQTVIYPYINDQGSILKAIVEIENNTVALYSAHLDYKHYACYLPRGYSGETWQKMEEPITNSDSILTANRKSKRLEAIEKFIIDAKTEIQKGHIVILGGDLNEQSHLDWQEETKNLWNHNGVDERERIDFIYYYPNQNITLKDVIIVGPSSSIVRSKREEEQSKDKFILPHGIWPTDHKAIYSKFELKQ